MKQVICITLFIVLFLTLHTLASWVFPFLFVLWFIVWIVIGLISLVLCKLVYDWLENQENGHLPPKRRAMVFFSILFVSISIFGFRYWNEFREKPLERVLDNYSYPEEVVINPNENTRKIIKDTQEIRELIDFLSQYEVQKSKNDYKYRVADPYEFWWKNDKGFRNPDLVMITIVTNDIWINTEHYKVLNGPVDMVWIRKYHSNN